VDDTLATIFLGDIAMNTRMYKRPGDTIGISVTNGFVKISHARISKELKKR
jgi:beta-fructofuranosidase